MNRSVLAAEIMFRTISPHEGLPNARVYAIAQDVDGFIWFGSEAGVHRYDGYQFISYAHDVNQPKSLSNDNVSCIQIDHQGALWMGTWGGGLNRFDFKSKDFAILPITAPDQPSDGLSLSDGRIQSLMLDKEGLLWAGTFEGGLNCIDPKTRKVKVYRHNPNQPDSLGNNRVWAISQDNKGLIWVGTDGGLDVLQPDGRFKHIPFDTGLASKEFAYRIRAITHCRNGDTWLGSENGLYIFKQKLNTVEPAAYSGSLPISGSVTQIYEDELNRLWVGTTVNGLYLVERGQSSEQILQVQQYQQESGKRGSIGFNDIRHIFRDRKGLLWLATRGGGVSIFNPLLDAITHVKQRKFAPYNEQVSNVTALLEESPERVWIGTLRNGLTRWDRSTGLSRAYETTPGSPRGISHTMVFSLAKGQNDEIWVGTYRGLNQYNQASNRFKQYYFDPANPNSLSSNQVRKVMCDHKGILWVGTYRSGVCKYDPNANQWTRYSSDGKPGDLGGNDITSIFEDKTGVVWVGTEGGGINRYDRKTNQFHAFWGEKNLLHSVRIVSIFQSLDAELWLATNLGDLCYFDKQANEWRQKLRFPGKGILAANIDHKGSSWYQTYSELHFKHPFVDQEINLDLSEWFPNFLGIESATTLNKRGEFLVAGSDGFLIIDAKQIDASHQSQARLELTGLKGLGESLKPHFEEEKNQLSMSYRQNSFNIEFALLDFGNSSSNRYSYQMDDSGEQWIELGSQNNLSFTRLAPGNYNLKIRASNHLGIPNPNQLGLKIHVQPPFWLTWWFQILAFCALALAIYFGYRRRVHKLHQQRDELERRVAERTRELEERNAEIMKQQKHIILQEKMASLGLLTAGIAHEIKNPLNFINNFSEVSMELARDLGDELGDHSQTLAPSAYEDLRETVDDLIENASLVRKHGQRANQIIAGMMDLTASSGKPAPTQLNKLVSDMTVLATGGLNSDHKVAGLAIRQQLNPALQEISIVAREIGRAIVALIKNSLDAVIERQTHGDANYEPTLLIGTDDLGDQLEISIWDNGVGIPNEILEKVFTPFFTTKVTGSGHIGLGLSLAYEVVQGHHGQLTIESDGSSFTLSRILLPKN